MARIAAVNGGTGRSSQGITAAAFRDRPYRRGPTLLLVCALIGMLVEMCRGADAQAYPQLHVTALSQRADRASVEPGGIFHLTIHVHITQRRDRLDDLILGTFVNCQIISNETVRDSVPGGTDFVERLTLQAGTMPGEATISPAYIDALDPALGKPMRFSSNAVRVVVTGPSPVSGALDGLAAAGRRLLLALAIVACVMAAAFLLFALFVRRKRKPAVVPAAPALVPPPPTVTPPAGLAGAADAYRRDRSQVALLALRGELFALAGARRGATLIDALRALGERDSELRTMLLTAENAAFGPAAERASAGDALLGLVDERLGRRPQGADAGTR